MLTKGYDVTLQVTWRCGTLIEPPRARCVEETRAALGFREKDEHEDRNMKTFGEFAREQLRQLGRNQKDLAEKLDVSPAYVSQILTGKKKPPDLGKQGKRSILRVWADFLGVREEELLEVVRFQLHRVPPRPAPRYQRIRRLLMERLSPVERSLADEITRMHFHPAENRAIGRMVQVYVVMQENSATGRGYERVRFREACCRAKASSDFIEGELARFFEELGFSWTWDPDANDVRFSSDAGEIRQAMEMIRRINGEKAGETWPRTVPVVGHVSAGEGFEFTDGGYPVGEGFEHVELPPGIDPGLADRLYCVRIRGQSLREFINEGALLFIKPQSWEEIRDGDLVIFKDLAENRAFVKKVEFSGESLILKPMNPMYKNIVLRRRELGLLERVMSIVL